MIYRQCDCCFKCHTVCVPYNIMNAVNSPHVCISCLVEFDHDPNARIEFERRYLQDERDVASLIGGQAELLDYCRTKAKEREAYTNDHIADEFIKKQVFGYYLDRLSKEDCWARVLVDHLEWKIDHKKELNGMGPVARRNYQTVDSTPIPYPSIAKF